MGVVAVCHLAWRRLPVHGRTEVDRAGERIRRRSNAEQAFNQALDCGARPVMEPMLIEDDII